MTIRNILGIFPRKFTAHELESKLALWLSIALMALLCYNIFSTGSLEKQAAFLKIEAAYKSLSPKLVNDELKQFEYSPFCGWKIDKLEQRSSTYFKPDQTYVEKQIGDNTLTICVLEISKTSQIIFCIVIYAILFFIVYRKFSYKTESNEEIPNSTEG